LNKVRKLFRYIKNRVMMNEQENIQDENVELNDTPQEEQVELSIEDQLANQLAEAHDKYARLVAHN